MKIILNSGGTRIMNRIPVVDPFTLNDTLSKLATTVVCYAVIHRGVGFYHNILGVKATNRNTLFLLNYSKQHNYKQIV